MVDEAFAPPGENWQPVSPRLRDLRRLLLVAFLVPAAVVAAVAVGVGVAWWLGLAVLVVALAVGAWAWWLLERSYRAWGYAERAEDLLVTRGVLIRRLVIVPYGRMQLVDVNAGPLDRRFGIATVQLHTAAAATDATIPGLPPAEAARLRERLAALGEARSAGL